MSAKSMKKKSEKSSGTDWKRIESMRDDEIDTSDIPPLKVDFWAKAALRMPKRKVSITTRIDEDILGWLKSRGKGYQTRINAILRAFMESHTR